MNLFSTLIVIETPSRVESWETFTIVTQGEANGTIDRRNVVYDSNSAQSGDHDICSDIRLNAVFDTVHNGWSKAGPPGQLGT